MKILVFSDSHGRAASMERVIGKCKEWVDAVIFLGDVVRDIAPLVKTHADIDFHIVKGNCDFISRYPSEQVAELGGSRVLITHGDDFGVKIGYDRIAQAAAQRGAAACFFGHTHVPYTATVGGVLLLNPGSIAYPRGRLGPSFAYVDITDGKIDVNIAEV